MRPFKSSPFAACAIFEDGLFHVGMPTRNLDFRLACGQMLDQNKYEGWFPIPRKLYEGLSATTVVNAGEGLITVCPACASLVAAQRDAKHKRDNILLIRAYGGQRHASQGPTEGGNFRTACGKIIYPDAQEVVAIEHLDDVTKVCSTCKRVVRAMREDDPLDVSVPVAVS